jgi:hypothetical protein
MKLREADNQQLLFGSWSPSLYSLLWHAERGNFERSPLKVDHLYGNSWTKLRTVAGDDRELLEYHMPDDLP